MQRPFILLAAVLPLGVTGRHASPVPVAVLNNRANLVEDALRILQSGFERHHIVLLRDFEVLQILLNLLRNAKRAIDDAGKPERLIRIRIRRYGDDRVRIEVTDSGVGLAPENATRIFAHGFTTKLDGHGFGLHSGALAARQLGGSLWAESDGPGLGATFTLELPSVATVPHIESLV